MADMRSRALLPEFVISENSTGCPSRSRSTPADAFSSTVARTPFRHIVLAGQMAVLGAFIGFVFIKDQPFKGQSAIDAKSIVQAISIMQARPE